MTDEIIDDFSMPASEYSIVDILNDFYERHTQYIEREEARRRDPNWRLEPIHVAPEHVFDIMEDGETSPERRNMLLMSTYVGVQWVRAGNEAPPRPLLGAPPELREAGRGRVMKNCPFQLRLQTKCKEYEEPQLERFDSIRFVDIEETDEEIICTVEFESEEEKERFLRAFIDSPSAPAVDGF